MKQNLLAWPNPCEGETIAVFGQARLVKQLTGKVGLLGGTPVDDTPAPESCSFFRHEAPVIVKR